MFQKHYPKPEQISGLSNLLNFLGADKIYWRKIELNGSTIVVKCEPPKGDIDLRVFYVNEDGRVEDDGFRD